MADCENGRSLCGREAFILPAGCPSVARPAILDVPACDLPDLVDTKSVTRPFVIDLPDVPLDIGAYCVSVDTKVRSPRGGSASWRAAGDCTTGEYVLDIDVPCPIAKETTKKTNKATRSGKSPSVTVSTTTGCDPETDVSIDIPCDLENVSLKPEGHVEITQDHRGECGFSATINVPCPVSIGKNVSGYTRTGSLPSVSVEFVKNSGDDCTFATVSRINVPCDLERFRLSSAGFCRISEERGSGDSCGYSATIDVPCPMGGVRSEVSVKEAGKDEEAGGILSVGEDCVPSLSIVVPSPACQLNDDTVTASVYYDGYDPRKNHLHDACGKDGDRKITDPDKLRKLKRSLIDSINHWEPGVGVMKEIPESDLDALIELYSAVDDKFKAGIFMFDEDGNKVPWDPSSGKYPDASIQHGYPVRKLLVDAISSVTEDNYAVAVCDECRVELDLPIDCPIEGIVEGGPSKTEFEPWSSSPDEVKERIGVEFKKDAGSCSLSPAVLHLPEIPGCMGKTNFSVQAKVTSSSENHKSTPKFIRDEEHCTMRLELPDFVLDPYPMIDDYMAAMQEDESEFHVNVMRRVRYGITEFLKELFQSTGGCVEGTDGKTITNLFGNPMKPNNVTSKFRAYVPTHSGQNRKSPILSKSGEDGANANCTENKGSFNYISDIYIKKENGKPVAICYTRAESTPRIELLTWWNKEKKVQEPVSLCVKLDSCALEEKVLMSLTSCDSESNGS